MIPWTNPPLMTEVTLSRIACSFGKLEDMVKNPETTREKRISRRSKNVTRPVPAGWQQFPRYGTFKCPTGQENLVADQKIKIEAEFVQDLYLLYCVRPLMEYASGMWSGLLLTQLA